MAKRDDILAVVVVAVVLYVESRKRAAEANVTASVVDKIRSILKR
jgi:hypothetical protein